MIRTVLLNQVHNGDYFVFSGVTFVKLNDEKDASFVIAADVIGEKCSFEKGGSVRDDKNNFEGSYIQAVVEGWLIKHPLINVATVDRPIDLTSMDGMTNYGCPVVHGRILTIDEYRKYRALIPLASDWYWLATPWATQDSPDHDAVGAFCVNADGTLYEFCVTDEGSLGPRPALYLKSSICVNVEIDPEKALRACTEAQLLKELLRRNEKERR